MKNLIRKIVGFVLLLMPLSQINAQYFVHPDHVWNVLVSGFGPEIYTIRYTFKDSSFVDGKLNLKVYLTDQPDNVGWQEIGSIREDSIGKVYYKSQQFAIEKLIYQFEAKLGDTLNYPTGDGSESCKILVTNVDTIQLLNGISRKRISLMTIAEEPWQQRLGTWIEGIGSEYGPVYDVSIAFCGFDYAGYLSCYYENDSIQYMAPNVEKCYVKTATKELKHLNADIFPNPSTREIKISTDYSLELEYQIFNQNGILVLKGKCGQTNSIEVLGLSDGAYYCLLKSKDGGERIIPFIKI